MSKKKEYLDGILVGGERLPRNLAEIVKKVETYPAKFNEENFRDKDGKLHYHYSEMSNVKYENIVKGMKIETIPIFPLSYRGTGVLSNGKKDKKFAKYKVRVLDFERVRGEIDLKHRNAVKFDEEVLCKLGVLKKDDLDIKAIQCFPIKKNIHNES